jgi:hypothetical protein
MRASVAPFGLGAATRLHISGAQRRLWAEVERLAGGRLCV